MTQDYGMSQKGTIMDQAGLLSQYIKQNGCININEICLLTKLTLEKCHTNKLGSLPYYQ